MPDILAVNNLFKSFGRLVAVDNLSFQIHEGEILGMIGPNGAGKTTVFDCLLGHLRPDSGKIVFKGADITHTSPSLRCYRGIGRTYQIPRPFGKMTAFENLLVAAVYGAGMGEGQGRREVRDILAFVGLSSIKDQIAGRLPFFIRKKLELGRALATRPNLILIDELAGGLTEGEALEIVQLVRQIQERGITIIWIEHVLTMMSEGVDRLLVLSEGAFLNCGRPEEVMASKDVLDCYFGTENP